MLLCSVSSSLHVGTTTWGRRNRRSIPRARGATPTGGLPLGVVPAPGAPRSLAASMACRTTATAVAHATSGPAEWTLSLVTHVPVRSDEYAPSSIGLELTVLSLDGKDSLKFPLVNTDPAKKYDRAREDLPGRIDTFKVPLPDDFEPAAIELRNLPDEGDTEFQKGGKYEALFVSFLAFQGSTDSSVHFTANSYVTPAQGDRLFVRDDAYKHKLLSRAFVAAPGDNWLGDLMDKDLALVRGEGEYAVIATMERKGSDRIYRYSPYDDLESPSKGGTLRAVLGGSADFPYPRRLQTNRPRDATNPLYESAPNSSAGIVGSLLVFLFPSRVVELVKGLFPGKGPLPVPWVPMDDNFDGDKSAGFIGNALTSVLPSVLTTLDSTFQGGLLVAPLRAVLRFLNLSQGTEFKNIADVLDLYDKDELYKLQAREGAESTLVPSDGAGGSINAKVAGLSARVDLRTGDTEAAGMEAQGLDDALDLLRYSVPRCLINRVDTWSDDAEFGRLFMAGQNPVVIEAVSSPERLQQLLGASAIKDVPGLTGLLEGSTLEDLAAADTPRLFVIDYWPIYSLLNAPGIQGEGRVTHAARAALFRNSKGFLVPVAIELTNQQGKPATVYTPNDPSTIWLLAKTIFMSVDSGWHQLISHWLRTHSCMEPFWLATRRNLSQAHPIFRLMLPHFRYTASINAAARSLLVNRDGVIESCFSPGPFSMQLSSKVYCLAWSFKDEGLPADLRKRGFLADGSTKLNTPDYPYAEDGLEIWSALNSYFTRYVAHYYSDDAQVVADQQLQAWWRDARENGHADKREGWIELKDRASLVEICCTIAWVASAHHAAVNFGQYDNSGWMPLHASLTRKPCPLRGSPEWEELAKLKDTDDKFEKLLLTYVSPPTVTTEVMSVVKLLAAHAKDEQYLSSDHQDWIRQESDPTAHAIFMDFVTEVKEVEARIDARNADPAKISRNPDQGGLPYTLLLPTSGPGVTSRGVPYSVSI